MKLPVTRIHRCSEWIHMGETDYWASSCHGSFKKATDRGGDMIFSSCDMCQRVTCPFHTTEVKHNFKDYDVCAVCLKVLSLLSHKQISLLIDDYMIDTNGRKYGPFSRLRVLRDQGTILLPHFDRS